MSRYIIFLLATLLIAACESDIGSSKPTEVNLTRANVALDSLPFSVNQQDGERQLPTAVPDTVIADADAEHLLLTNLYERSTPSVVNIEVIIIDQFGSTETARGSGFVYDRNGHIITNAHVVSDASSIVVTFDDGYVAVATVVGADIYSDIAVIKVDVDINRLLPLTLADSDILQVGERAIAIGNPFGLSSSMTVGIISGLGRQLSSAAFIDSTAPAGFQNPHIIQVDTDINPGNSGGPLLNSRGEVIGVNTAIRTESGIFEGVGFAVPSNTAQRVVPEVIEKGHVDYSWMGISTLSSEISLMSLAEPLGLPVDAGILVTSVTPNSPANKSGLKGGNYLEDVRGVTVCAGGDIIIAVDGNYVANMDELVAHLIIETRPGDTITLLIVRDNETFEIPLTLESRPSSGNLVQSTCG